MAKSLMVQAVPEAGVDLGNFENKECNQFIECLFFICTFSLYAILAPWFKPSILGFGADYSSTALTPLV